MKPIFDKIKLTRPKQNVFDLSHEKKLSCKFGDLVPVLLQEIVPGDKFRVSTELLARLAPLMAPVMHRVNIQMHYFFVPNRLIHEKWEEFITGGRLGTSTVTEAVLEIRKNREASFNAGTLADYLGVPTTDGTMHNDFSRFINALPFRAYQLIYNEYYRDQNLSAPVEFSKSDGAVSDADFAVLTAMRKKAWEKDYFTSALPWAQRGPEVMIPVEAEITYSDVATVHNNQINQSQDMVNGNLIVVDGEVVNDRGANPDASGSGIHNIDEIDTGAYTINDLRRATRLQEWLEKNARAGGRLIEQVLAHFGVRSSDARLQRPEFLGGFKQPIVISEVLSNYETAESEPQGNMTGHGISAGGNHGFTRFFEEHGFVIGIMSILPRTAYQQGLHRLWERNDKFSYYWPEFAQLGEQEVYDEELYLDYSLPYTNRTLFGYQSRYSEYKFNQDSVHGEFRNSLNFWHMGRIFGNKPQLNAAFVTSDAETPDRCFAVTDPAVDKVYLQLYHSIKAQRSMPVFGVPSF